MRTIARFMDARNTAEGKFLSVLLSVLLVFSFLNVTMFTDYAGADTTPEGDGTEIVTPLEDVEEPEAQPEDEADGPESEEPAEEVNETEPAAEPEAPAEEPAVEEPEAEEAPAPEAFEGYAHVGNITVKVTAEAGVVPTGTEVHAKRVSDGAVREAVEEAVTEEGKSLDGYEAIDVTLVKDGQEIQPDGKVNVCFFDANLEGEDVAVYHVTDDASTVTEVDARQAEVDVQSFDVEHFSIYVVGTTSNIVTYEFYRGADDTIPVSIQSVKEGEEVFEPTAESLAGKRFLGWYAEGSDEPFAFGRAGAVAEPGKTVRVIARYGVAHHVFFMSDTADDARVIWTKSAFEGDEITTDGVSYPLSGDESITGWYEDKTLSGDPVETLTMGDENMMLFPRIEKGCWVTYDSNGGSYVKKEFVAKGGHAAGAAAPTRPGYEFAGWYADGATSPFDFNTALSEDITLHAEWKGLETTYTIIYWVENPNFENPYLDQEDQGKEQYSFKSSKTLKANSGDVVDFNNLSAVDKGIAAIQRELGTGFENGRVDAAEAVKTVNGDGSTVFNVRFDRIVYTLGFDKISEKRTCGLSEHEHSWSEGCYKRTCNNKYHWHSRNCYDLQTLVCNQKEHQHSGSCYETTYKHVIEAKYGANIVKAWPKNSNNAMDWQVDGSTASQVGLQTMPNENRTYSDSSSSYGTESADYYVESLDGARYVLHHTDVSSRSWRGGATITKEELYPIEGFTLDEERSSKIEDDYDGSKFYYTRNSYNLRFFSNSQELTGHTESLKFEASLVSKYWEPKEAPAGMEGYEFQGWYDNDLFAGEAFNFDQKMPAHDVILYAKWAMPSFDVTIHDSMDGSDGAQPEQVGQGMTIAKPADPDSIPGKRFVGWATRTVDEDGGYVYEVWNFGNEVRDDVELYPWFVSENASQVAYSFGENAGKLADTLLPRDAKLYDESAAACVAGFNTADAQAALEEAGVENCVFLGWTDGTHSYQPGDRMPVKGDVTLTAMWGKAPKGTILVLHDNYPTAGQVAPQDTTQTYKLRNNQQHTLDYVPNNIPEGYYFMGWSKAKNPTESQIDFEQGQTVVVDNGTTLNPTFENHLYAVYAKYLTVTYNPNGGEIDGSVEKKVVKENSAGQPLKKGDDTPLVNQPVRDGYTFGGWQDVDDNKIYTSTNFPKLSRDVEYRAVWKEQKFEVDKTVTNTGTGENGAFKVGDTINYKVEVKNTGEVAYEKPIYLKDSLVNLSSEGVNAKSSNGSKIVLDDPDFAGAIVKGLQIGETATITYSYVIPQTAKTVTNKIIDETTNKSDEVDVTVEDNKAYTAAKSYEISKAEGNTAAGKAEVGDTINYTVTVTNTGNVATGEVVLTDTFTGSGIGCRDRRRGQQGPGRGRQRPP